MGASTGGPRALLSIIRSLPKHLSVAVFIVQHMPQHFTKSFAKRLNEAASINVTEAVEGQIIETGNVYLAPGGKHMTLKNNTIHLDENPKIHGVRPAVDVLFQSAAKKYQEKLLGIVLTGMGNDGVEGCRYLKEAGGFVITQDEDSCVIYGMPRNVEKKGYSDRVANLVEISNVINEMVG